LEFKDSVETVENASMLSGYSLKAIIKTLLYKSEMVNTLLQL